MSQGASRTGKGKGTDPPLELLERRQPADTEFRPPDLQNWKIINLYGFKPSNLRLFATEAIKTNTGM